MGSKKQKQRLYRMGGLKRDRYGITQLVFDEERTPKAVFEKAQNLGREFVIQIRGSVIERESKNPNMNTGAVEVLVEELTVLNEAQTPPFTIEDQTDGGEELAYAIPLFRPSQKSR